MLIINILTSLTAEREYSVNFIHSNKKFVWSLHYNGSDSFLFNNATKIYQFKTKKSEMKQCPLFLGNISKDFTFGNLKKRKENWKEVLFFFCWLQTY